MVAYKLEDTTRETNKKRRKVAITYLDWIDNCYESFLRGRKRLSIKQTTKYREVGLFTVLYECSDDGYSDSEEEVGYIGYKPMFSYKLRLYMYKNLDCKNRVERAILMDFVYKFTGVMILLSPLILLYMNRGV